MSTSFRGHSWKRLWVVVRLPLVASFLYCCEKNISTKSTERIKKIMKKSIIAIVAVLLVAGAGGGYYFLTKEDSDTKPSENQTSQASEQNNQQSTQEQPVQDEALTVDSAIAKLQAAGLTVGEKEGAFYQMIGATNGDKVSVDDVTVEFYEFDDESKATAAEQQLAGDSSTVFSIKSFVVLVHSIDSTKVDTIKNGLQ